MVITAPYGTWQSPISAADVAAGDDPPAWVAIHGTQVWWARPRATEGGRVGLYRGTTDGGVREVLGGAWNVRNRVHEYGGRPWVIVPGSPDRLAFTHWADQRIYLVPLTGDGDLAGEPEPITAEGSSHGTTTRRYAELTAGPDGASVWCVRETVTGPAPTDIRRDLVAVPFSGDEPTVLAAGHHFMSAPQPSPDGTRLAWLGWNHPDMPWDGTELCVADLAAAERGSPEYRVLAGSRTESVCQFEWESPDALLCSADRSGWWNPLRVSLHGEPVELVRTPQEIGGPLWKLGSRWFAPLGGGRHAVLCSGALTVLDEADGSLSEVPGVPPHWSGVVARDGIVAGVAGGPDREPEVLSVDLRAPGAAPVAHSGTGVPQHAAYLPTPRARMFTGPDGTTVPAHVFAPSNPDYTAPDGEAPPYLVYVHGGPTGQAGGGLQLTIAYFTSRGFGVVAPNYGGSTGYGRVYRERLREQWGVVDVADCAMVARSLVAEGGADGDRIAIRGGSAGGWTSAASLVSETLYRCGTVMFPVLDLRGWSAEGGEVHDMESRYVDGLVGPLAEVPERYDERSPANHADRLAGPVLMLQGLEDEICPPAQADRFMAGLAGSGIPHAYLRFAGEQHGFRQASTIRTALEAELSFYGQVFGFVPPGVPTLELSC